MDRLLYIHRVAKLLDCSRPMVYKLIYEGKLKAVRIGKRGIRISEPSLEEFIEENTIIPDEFFLKDVNGNTEGVDKGDVIVIPLDSIKYNELAGVRMTITSVNKKGVYVNEAGEPGDVFIPFGYFNIPKDHDCDIHGK